MKEALISVVVVTVNRKKDLLKCLQSLQASDYKGIEIMVVDNDSTPSVSSWLYRTFPMNIQIKVVRSDKNLRAAGGRNLGIKFAKSKYLLFMDDDSFADRAMVGEFVKILKNKKEVGIVQPKIYDMEKRNILQGIGWDVNLLTGRVSSVGIREEDEGQYDKIRAFQKSWLYLDGKKASYRKN